MIRSLFGRLLFSHLAVIIVSTVILGASLSYLIRDHVVTSKQVELINKGGSAIAMISPDLAAGHLPSPETIQRLGELTESTVWLADKDGNVLAGQAPRRWTRYFDDDDAQLNAMFEGRRQSWSGTDGRNPERFLVVALPVRDAKQPAALFFLTSINGINQAALAVEVLLAYSLLIGMAAAIVLGYYMSRSLTRPISDIGLAAKQFAKGDFTSRTTVTGDDELGKLGQVFNGMADSLSKAEQNRREFLANVTHEIKTPIAAIQAMTEALIDKVAGPEQEQRYLETIVAQTRHMTHLVQDLLDLAQLQAGELKAGREAFDLQTQLSAIAERVAPLMTEKSIRLELAVAGGDLFVLADPRRLEQVMNNLISNAVRHSPAESVITVNVEKHAVAAVIKVIDQGEGIAPDDLPHIWERFFRVEKSRSRSSGGSGLGLAITQRLVQAMDGDISVVSSIGQGTTFTFTLPLAQKTA